MFCPKMPAPLCRARSEKIMSKMTSKFHRLRSCPLIKSGSKSSVAMLRMAWAQGATIDSQDRGPLEVLMSSRHACSMKVETLHHPVAPTATRALAHRSTRAHTSHLKSLPLSKPAQTSLSASPRYFRKCLRQTRRARLVQTTAKTDRRARFNAPDSKASIRAKKSSS